MTRHHAAWCGAAMLALAASDIGAQSSASASARSTVDGPSDTSFAITRNGVIDITLRTGRLVVRGAERSTAELRAGGSGYELRSSGASATLALAEPFGRRGGVRASSYRRSDEPEIELLVPRSVRLVIHGASADVTVSDVAGDVELHLQSGDARLETLGGRAFVETISGDVSVTNGVGDLRVTTVSGDLTAQGVRGAIDVHTTSGTMSIDADRAARVQVDAVTGDILFEGSLADDARLQFSSHSGDIGLRLPESAGGTLDVSTFSGEVSGGAMTLLPSGDVPAGSGRANQPSRRYQFGGGGTARITVSTFNGDVSLQRGARRRSE